MTSQGPVLVTGAAGFIGSRLVNTLRNEGTAVISVDHTEHFRSRKEHTEIDFGQIVDRARLFEWLKSNLSSNQPLAAIYHLGACTDTTELDEAYLKKMNLKYSQQIWDYASRNRIPLTYASSAAVYGDGQLGYDDNESLTADLRPLNPYGNSKLKFDLWALEQERKGKQPPHWSAFRFFNVYGFGERHKTKMSSVALQGFDQVRKSGKIRLFRSHREGIPDGHQKRDFIYVDDVIQVLRFAIDKPISRGIYNLGTGQARTFLDLARAVFKALNQVEKVEYFDTPEGLRDRYQYFTEAKMEKLRQAGFEKHFTSLEDGVHKYVQALIEEGEKKKAPNGPTSDHGGTKEMEA